VRLLAVSLICGAALNLILTVTLIGPYGLIGVAASVAISAVVVNVIGIPLLLQKALGLPVKDLLLGACVRPMVLGLLLAIVLMCIRLTGRPNDWPHLLLHGMLAAVSVVALVLMVGVNTEERHRFVVQPIRRLLKKETAAPKANPR
jgi:peptidoglycan biosynthesis protein MviN/MurJ (putative lipid II flippase)